MAAPATLTGTAPEEGEALLSEAPAEVAEPEDPALEPLPVGVAEEPAPEETMTPTMEEEEVGLTTVLLPETTAVKVVELPAGMMLVPELRAGITAAVPTDVAASGWVVMAPGWVVMAPGWVVMARGCEVTTAGWPVMTPREFVSVR